MNNIDPS